MVDIEKWKVMWMYSFSINDLLKASCIGQHVTVTLYCQTVIHGTLNEICSGYIRILDAVSGLNQDIPNQDIKLITFDGYSKSQKINSLALSEFKRQCEKAADENKVTFGYLFRDELEYYIECCHHHMLKEYIQAEICNKGARYTLGEYDEIYEYLLADETAAAKNQRTFHLIQILLLFRLRRYNDAVAYAVELLGKNITDGALVLACLSIQMKNQMEALFWLEKFYFQAKLPYDVLQKSWWLYLRLISKYSAYESIVPLLKVLAENYPKMAIQSLAYLLLSNNSVTSAAQLLDYIDCCKLDEVYQMIERNSSFLMSDPDNNYHRFLRCIQNIFNNNAVTYYETEEDVTGYVVDYVPDREYGFILGFDLIVYFFRKESVSSNNVTKHIRNNICSMLSVDEEELVMVTFKRSSDSKRAYNAINIV